MTIAWKVFTSDLRSPVQGGDPVWSGALPYDLPSTYVDESERECAAGWSACRDLATALKFAGLWSAGRPSRAFRVSTRAAVVERGDKLRAATWTVEREATQDEVREAIGVMSRAFGQHAAVMAEAQRAWRCALARPHHDVARVVASLRQALAARGLADWTVRRYRDAAAAMSVKATRSTKNTRDVSVADAARRARAAWYVWAGRVGGTAMGKVIWATMNAWDPMDVDVNADALDAKKALTLQYAALTGWSGTLCPDMLTVGLITAYAHGLACVFPTGPNELGFAMVTL